MHSCLYGSPATLPLRERSLDLLQVVKLKVMVKRKTRINTV